jgi:uncharacterized protein YecT (DUF1311 family)
MRAAPVFLLLALAPQAMAEEPAVNCAEAVAQVDLNLCAERAWKFADEDLNLAYGFAVTMMKDIDAGLAEGQRGAEAALREAQRAWIAFRDAGCTAEGYRVAGGSMQPMVVAMCLERVTRARTEELRALAETW